MGLDGFDRPGVDQGGPRGQLGELAREIARTMRDDGLGKAVLRHLDPSRGDDDQAGRYAAGSHDIVARLIGSGLAEPPHSAEIGRRQCRKHLVATAREGGTGNLCHGGPP